MIGFLTDWSVKSHYVGVAKAVMKRINPSVDIIDITHEIEPFNVRMASHILLRASKDFPEGSIFVAVVDYGVGTSRKAICMRTKNEQYYVGPDNGIFTHVALEYGVKQVRELNNKSTTTLLLTPSTVETSSHQWRHICRKVCRSKNWATCFPTS